jgi:hypothetical protein
MTNIYFIRNNEGNIKIGRSINLEIRKNNLQVASPNDLIILYYIKDVEESFEKFIHLICKNYLISGEWFTHDCIDHLLNHPWYKSTMIKYKKIR